jgi:hypothetical protein
MLPDGEVALCPEEFELPTVPAQRVGDAVSRETLMSEVRDESWLGSTKTLDITIAGLRRRLTETSAGTSLRLPRITTRGVTDAGSNRAQGPERGAGGRKLKEPAGRRTYGRCPGHSHRGPLGCDTDTAH